MYVKINNCIPETCKYLLIWTSKNAIAELQYLSNKTKQTNKQTEIYILRLSFKTQLKNWVFCAV